MGTTLTGTTPQDTYDSLIKVTDNGPLSGSLKKLTDGLGNDSALSLSTGAASIAGTLAVSSTSAFGGNVAINGSASSLDINPTTGQPNITLRSGNTFRGYIEGNASGGLSFGSGASAAIGMTLTSAGNVGIGTSTPNKLLHLKASNDNASLQLENTANDKVWQLIPSYPNVANSGISIYNVTDNVVTAHFTNNGYLRLATGGIQFNGDTAAANALDDYEEGTWTPSVAFGGASVGVVLSVANGATYTKIGRQVTVNGFFAITSKGSSTGAATITGLPFTIGNGAQFYAAASLFTESISFVNVLQGRGDNNTTTIQLFEVTEAGVLTTITNADFTDTSNINLSLTYFV
jgi:hypothetical protein